MMNVVTGPRTGIGLAAFDSLHAEMEAWLDECLVLPPDFELMAGRRSYLVVGAEGSGKTTLFRALRTRLEPRVGAEGPPAHLTVHWRPRSLQPGLVGKAAALDQLASVLADCADALLAYLAHWPERFQAAPADMQATLTWFVCRYLGVETDRRLVAHARGASPSGVELLHQLPRQVEPDNWLEHAEPNELIAEMIKALRTVGPQVIYVLVDPDHLGDSSYLTRDLSAFLSSLTLFENAGFIYKIVMAERLLKSIGDATAVDRRRIDLATLTWEPEDLLQIVIERIRLATGCEIDSLEQVCADRQLDQWLQRTGGDSPRGWLQSITPLMVWYLRRRRPITIKEWRAIRVDPPPALRFDDQTGTISVGWRRITDVSDVPLALFAYLFEHKGQVCSREHLYYEAYLPAAEPDIDPASKEYTDKCAHLLESAILRLRQSIEPDPRSPLYIATDRGVGYKLQNVR